MPIRHIPTANRQTGERVAVGRSTQREGCGRVTVRRIGCIGDVHGALGALRTCLDYLRAADVEGVLLTGDFERGPLNRDPALGNTATPAEILDLVTSSFAHVLMVPGNHDQPSLGGDWSVDRREVEWLGWRVAGVGGSPYTGGRFPYEWKDADADLPSWDSPDILLAHSPPAGVLDVTATGKAVGSNAIRSIAEQMAGLLVCGHIHEAVGSTYLGNCLCYNAGSLGQPFGAVQCGVAMFDGGWSINHVTLGS